MNYIIEDNLDFKAAMENDSVEENTICLISQQPLTKSHIQLPCKHAFNYKPLYKEFYIQKTVRNMYETVRLKINELKCPYCRSVSEQLLPYLPSEEPERKNGVNSPTKYCMPYTLVCEWSTPNKDKVCAKPACYIDSVSYCKTHYLKTHKAPKETSPKLTIEWTSVMTTFSKNKTLLEMKGILRSHKIKLSGNKKELVERIFMNKLVL